MRVCLVCEEREQMHGFQGLGGICIKAVHAYARVGQSDRKTKERGVGGVGEARDKNSAWRKRTVCLGKRGES